MNFDTLRQEALASPLAAAVQGGASGLGRHARAETKLLLSRAFGRLVGAFHKKRSVEPMKLTDPDSQSIHFPENYSLLYSAEENMEIDKVVPVPSLGRAGRLGCD